MIGHFTDDERVLEFINSNDLERLGPLGTSCPDHFLRTKISPLILTLKPDETVQCTACYLCATACPAECIYIEAGEYADKSVEKFPIRYEIDTLRCIYCGYGVEACPCDAIRMDTGTHPGNLGFSRKDFVETKEVLMQRSKDLAEKGKEGLYEEYVKPYRHV